MIQPVLAHDAFLNDVRNARVDSARLHLWWLGQSGFLVQWHGHHLLLDPYLSDSLTRKYAGTDKPHVRMTALAIEPRRLDFIDAASSSHHHTDHLDADTLCPLLLANPGMNLIIPEANRAFVAERLGISLSRPLGVDDGGSVDAGRFRLHGIAAAHEQLERDERGRCKFLGYVVEAGPWRLYHSGDTVLYEGMIDRLRKWSPDIALLPINGRAPERRVAGNLNGPEAARLAKEIGAGLAIPCHYEMFEFNTASPDAFIEEARRIGQPVHVLRCGERWSSGPRSAARI
ncbi:MAG: MBL fold metallo-hydrolase [Planctomycetes bacterium]|nr:MBL fold metallo-hydrolase [Planctomycetota bacterium]